MTGQSGGGGSSAIPALVTIGVPIVVSVPAATITHTLIPGTYQELRLALYGRCSTAAIEDDVTIRFNGDTGANYDYQTLISNNTIVSASSAAAAAFGYLARLPGANAPVNAASGIVASIPLYASTTFTKQCTSIGGDAEINTTAGHYVTHFVSFWRSTAAITQITLAIASGANFAAGTTSVLYGIG